MFDLILVFFSKFNEPNWNNFYFCREIGFHENKRHHIIPAAVLLLRMHWKFISFVRRIERQADICHRRQYRSRPNVALQCHGKPAERRSAGSGQRAACFKLTQPDGKKPNQSKPYRSFRHFDFGPHAKFVQAGPQIHHPFSCVPEGL